MERRSRYSAFLSLDHKTADIVDTALRDTITGLTIIDLLELGALAFNPKYNGKPDDPDSRFLMKLGEVFPEIVDLKKSRSFVAIRSRDFAELAELVERLIPNME